ncbi:uncharacterized protein DUF1376 [Aminobacter aminovorans]|uniref:Uncharacterized protein conserved in bacteria n=1 Tax=Aminobacter aminovorans TaxID=83263 RepID=A0A380WMB0_AMIAI|nr:YdaU family protein [Aminobacter aminovorans]TCS27597.1 uncharacterized protein DUF1376 [Aminobacter aminovorans]SUU89990.1 Uncharacterized protein conserved in bacteria [Aminobacter aminovorans]
MSAAPWFRLHTSDWITATRDLKAAEKGILIDLLAHMHERGGPIAGDHARLARLCGADIRTFSRAIELFLADGRIVEKHGGLWSPVMQAEFEHRKNVSDVRRKNAGQRWAKVEQNQRDENAKAHQSPESREEEGGGGNPPPRSTSASSTVGVDSSSTLEGSRRVAPSGAPLSLRKTFMVDDDVEVAGIGPATISRADSVGFVTVRAEADGRDYEVEVLPGNQLRLVDKTWLNDEIEVDDDAA